MNERVVTRFAPSPTGYLHIGGARTALFNWLFAKKHGGKMLLRIEDTDRARYSEDSVNAILDGLSWLGIDWDGDPISQFAGVERHRGIVQAMLDAGTAYRCYASSQELEEMRTQAKSQGRPTTYDGRWRDRDPTLAPKNVAPVIRVKTPQSGDTIIQDAVQGTVRIPNKNIDDFVIMRSDATPTYMLAVVVDDHDMGVTHIIRGDDHLTNAARQICLFNALKWSIPVFAHIPLIHGADGTKLSKRHGALGAEAYRALGFLPDALKNYLVRLGWAKGDEEIISQKDMIAWFDLEGINKAAARFDITKLGTLNAHYLRLMNEDDLFAYIKAILPEIDQGGKLANLLTNEKLAMLKSGLPILKDRAKTLVELIDNASFIYNKRPLEMSKKAYEILTPDARVLLAQLVTVFEPVEQWESERLDEVVRAFMRQNDLKLGKLGPPLRCALTGDIHSPGIFDVLALLGKNESLARLRDQLS